MLVSSPAHDWIDLVTCDTATPVAVYDHPAWNRYTAVAKNRFGKGSTLYLAAFFGDDLLEKILRDYLTETGCTSLTADAPHFPVIVKRGKNDMNKAKKSNKIDVEPRQIVKKINIIDGEW